MPERKAAQRIAALGLQEGKLVYLRIRFTNYEKKLLEAIARRIPPAPNHRPGLAAAVAFVAGLGFRCLAEHTEEYAPETDLRIQKAVPLSAALCENLRVKGLRKNPAPINYRPNKPRGKKISVARGHKSA